MIDYSSPAAMKVRELGQWLGVLRPLQRFMRRATGAAYEENFEATILNLIKPGDIVWDVGANDGFYTERFADKVTPNGRIVAFEPSPRSYAGLSKRMREFPLVVVENIALSSEVGTAKFYVNSDESVTDSMFERSSGVERTAVDVEVSRGDAYAASHDVPHLVKVDVEGFEYEVVHGLDGILGDPKLRGVFIEVHFRVLNERGMSQAPKQIVELLKKAGFAVRWSDSSHIVAQRASS